MDTFQIFGQSGPREMDDAAYQVLAVLWADSEGWLVPMWSVMLVPPRTWTLRFWALMHKAQL